MRRRRCASGAIEFLRIACQAAHASAPACRRSALRGSHTGGVGPGTGGAPVGANLLLFRPLLRALVDAVPLKATLGQ